MTIDELKEFKTALAKLEQEARKHYSNRYALYKKLDCCLGNTTPEKLVFSHVDEEDVCFHEFHDSDNKEYISLKSLADQEADLKNLEHDLLLQVERQKQRRAKQLENGRSAALLEINRLKEKYGL